MGKVKLIKNAPLKIGDKIRAVRINDPDIKIAAGTAGVVQGIDEVMGPKFYRIKWSDGLKLGIVDGVDDWVKIDSDDEPINENKIILVRSKADILDNNYITKTKKI